MHTALTIAVLAAALFAAGAYVLFCYQTRILKKKNEALADFRRLYEEKKGVECRTGAPVPYNLVRIRGVWHNKNERNEITGIADPDLLDYLEQAERFDAAYRASGTGRDPFLAGDINYFARFGIRVRWDPSVIPR